MLQRVLVDLEIMEVYDYCDFSCKENVSFKPEDPAFFFVYEFIGKLENSKERHHEYWNLFKLFFCFCNLKYSVVKEAWLEMMLVVRSEQAT